MFYRHPRCACSKSFIDRMEDSRDSDLLRGPDLEDIFHVNKTGFNMEGKSEDSEVDFLITLS